MFSLKVAFALFAVAGTALAQDSSSNSTQCDDAPLLCCTYSSAGSSDEMRAVGSALHMEVDPAKMYATGCSAYNPINVGGGTECTAAPICCENNYFGLLVGVGCTTIPVGV